MSKVLVIGGLCLWENVQDLNCICLNITKERVSPSALLLSFISNPTSLFLHL